jgi:hypothetical protein
MTLTAPDPFAYLAERLDPTPSPYAKAPVLWVKEKLREHMTLDQRAIAKSVVENRYTAVPSCHDVGKSFTASRLVGWWLESHPPGEAFVVTTAPTAAQVSAILWREIGKAHRAGGLMGYVTGNNEWKIGHGKGGRGDGAELIAYGRKPADYDPSGFVGIHARFVLIIVDEACGVPRSLFEAVDSLATNEQARVLAIGNPDDPASYFQEICKPGSGWHVIHIDALRSPNFTAEEVSKYPRLRDYMRTQGILPTREVIPESLRDMLVSAQWVDERIKRWGVDSPIFASKVRGRFPKVSIDSVISPHWVTLAQSRELTPNPMLASRLGVDVARYGTDQSIILMRQGGHCRVVLEVASGPVTQLAGEVQRIGYELNPHLPPLAAVDDVGVGGGVTDILQENHYPVTPIISSERASTLLPNGKPRFNNKRSELWWNMREAFSGPQGDGEAGWLDIDPLDDELAAQLTQVKYVINSSGQICVETKDQMKARGLGSPDRADALAYALCPDPALTQAKPREDLLINQGLLEEKW